MEIIILGYFLTIIGGIWALIRLLRYSFGSYSDYIYIPPLAWISLIVGIWIPFLSYIVLAYILLWCKSVATLMSTRENIIDDMTAEFIVESVEQQVLEQSLTGDDWVVNTWGNTSKEAWINRLSSNRELLRQALEKNIEIHASNLMPYGRWDEVVKHYIYLDKAR
jgi:hypothetical protein